jgi:hypothetical protein
MEKKPIASKLMHIAKKVPTAVQHAITYPMAMKPVAVQPAAQAPTKAHCQTYMHRYVGVHAADGCFYDGIVEHVDDQWLHLAVPGAVDPMRGFIPFSQFYPPYAPYRPRRFERLSLPIAGLRGMTLLPYY